MPLRWLVCSENWSGNETGQRATVGDSEPESGGVGRWCLRAGRIGDFPSALTSEPTRLPLTQPTPVRTSALSILRRGAPRSSAVTVDPAGGVLLVAPECLATDQLDGIVARKAEWIVRRLRRAQSGSPPRSPREFVSGESVLYLGRHYRLKVHPYVAGEAKLLHVTGEAEPHDEAQPRGEAKSGAGRAGGGRLHSDAKLPGDQSHVGAKLPGDRPTGGAKLRGGWLHVPAPVGAGQAAHVRAALVAWLRGHAAARLPERMEVWRAKAGVAMPRVVVADQRKRWGSCDRSGTIRLNWRIIQAPMRLVDYVVVHELVHLRHRGHGRDYWRAVARVMPDYERRREELRRCGVGLVW